MHDDQIERPAPRRRDPEARRAAMVSAAAALISERGAGALTHRAVAARAGVSLGTTTAYFASLEALREAALCEIAAHNDEVIDAMGCDLARDPVTAERLAAMVSRYLADAAQVRHSMALAAAGLVDARMNDLASRATRRMVDVLARHVGADRAAALGVYLEGVTMHVSVTGAPPTRRELARVMAAILAL